jgi:hypothetical protein
MTPEERRFALEEFGRTRERWTDLQLQTTFRNSDLLIKTGDREFDLILALASISVAFITVVVPLTASKSSIVAILLFNLSLVYFFTCALTGIVQLLWLIYHDRKYLKERDSWEMEQLKIFQEKTDAIYEKLRNNQDVTDKEMMSVLAQNEATKKEAKDKQDALDKKISTRVLNLLHRLFFSLFFVGFICLFLFLYFTK